MTLLYFENCASLMLSNIRIENLYLQSIVYAENYEKVTIENLISNDNNVGNGFMTLNAN